MNVFVKRGLVAFVVVSVLLTAVVAVMTLTFPIINDIATDPAKPPSFFVQPRGSKVPLSAMGYNTAFASMQRRAYPLIAPIFVPRPQILACDLALAVAKRQMGWTIVAREAEAARFQAVATTAFWRFKDDVVVTCDSVAGGTEINVRSRSRIGKSDFGANAKRIRQFSAALAAASRQHTPAETPP